jgi:hypothetical protein
VVQHHTTPRRHGREREDQLNRKSIWQYLRPYRRESDAIPPSHQSPGLVDPHANRRLQSTRPHNILRNRLEQARSLCRVAKWYQPPRVGSERASIAPYAVRASCKTPLVTRSSMGRIWGCRRTGHRTSMEAKPETRRHGWMSTACLLHWFGIHGHETEDPVLAGSRMNDPRLSCGVIRVRSFRTG